MSTPQTTYLLTGANRGIGLGLASILLSRPHTTLIALVRDPSHPTSQSLASHPKADNTTLIILPYSATSADSALTTISTLRTDHHITHIDVVIANAGAMYGPRSPVESVSVQNITDSVAVNCVSTVLLFQATLPLLRAAITTAKPPAATGGGSVASANEGTGDGGQGVNGPAAEEEEEVGARKGKHEPKFIAISSAIGSTELIGKHMHAQTPGYGMSKAALNWAMRKASFEVRGEGICVEL
jgi:norsolorinic acid ketoreductase